MKGLDRDHLIRLSGQRAFRRGEEYFFWRRVRSLAEDDGGIRAIVDGEQSYRVRLQEDGEQLGYECNCPEGALGRFCKHCVAVGLGWLEIEKRGKAIGDDPDLNDVARLFDFAAQLAASAEDVAAVSDVLKEVEATLARLLEEGFAEQAAALIESSPAFFDLIQTEAIKRLRAVLLAYHQKGCRQAQFTAESIAGRLLAWQSRCLAVAEAEIVEEYSSLLGQQGRQAYRLLVQAEWDHLHASGGHTPAQREKCTRLTELIEHLARECGDIATLIALKSRHLEEADRYLEIARLCKQRGQAGDDELALDWARRGAERFPAQEAERLYEFLVEAHLAQCAWQEALGISFTQFCARPTLHGYQRIAEYAQRAEEWDGWRERALGVFRQANPPTNSQPSVTTSDQSTLVSILLWENKDEDAWQTAQQGECGEDLWQEIAKRHSKKRPDDALHIYTQLVTRYASRKNRYSYQAAIRVLRRIAQLLRKRKRQDEFLPYAENLCRKHRYQHAFVRMLKQLMIRHSPRKSSESD